MRTTRPLLFLIALMDAQAVRVLAQNPTTAPSPSPAGTAGICWQMTTNTVKKQPRIPTMTLKMNLTNIPTPSTIPNPGTTPPSTLWFFDLSRTGSTATLIIECNQSSRCKGGTFTGRMDRIKVSSYPFKASPSTSVEIMGEPMYSFVVTLASHNSFAGATLPAVLPPLSAYISQPVMTFMYNPVAEGVVDSVGTCNAGK